MRKCRIILERRAKTLSKKNFNKKSKTYFLENLKTKIKIKTKTQTQSKTQSKTQS